jgi:F5/8 type C domain
MVKGIKVTNSEITVGGVNVAIWSFIDLPAHHHDRFQVDVGATGDDDWVCIGGGALGHFSPGNFLTASFPSLDANSKEDWKGWVVASRDHTNDDVAPLTGYAIGMKIPPLSKQELINNLKLFQVTSPTATPYPAHPEASCFVEPGYLLLGGGFFVMDQIQDKGNMATGSFPDSTISWRARSKDHFEANPSRIQVFAIGIKSTLTNTAEKPVGNVVTTFRSLELVEDSDIETSVEPLPDMALCGGGAASHYSSRGRYIVELRPAIDTTSSQNKQTFTVWTGSVAPAAHLDDGRVTAYAMGIKFTPAPQPPPQPPGVGGGQPPQQSECNKEIAITDAMSSGNQPTFVPRNAIDRNPNTKWQSTFTSNPWIRLSLGGLKQVCRVDIIWADTTQYHFNISVSTGGAYTDVLIDKVRTGTSTTTPEPYVFAVTQANSIQITITQSTPGSTNSIAQISEISVFSNQS